MRLPATQESEPTMTTATFQAGDIVATTFGGELHTGRVRYMHTNGLGRLVVADWKQGDDIGRNVPVFQLGVAVALVVAVVPATVFEVTCYAKGGNMAQPVIEGHYDVRATAVGWVEARIVEAGKPAADWTRGELGDGWQWFAECKTFGYAVTEVRKSEL